MTCPTNSHAVHMHLPALDKVTACSNTCGGTPQRGLQYVITLSRAGAYTCLAVLLLQRAWSGLLHSCGVIPALAEL